MIAALADLKFGVNDSYPFHWATLVAAVRVVGSRALLVIDLAVAPPSRNFQRKITNEVPNSQTHGGTFNLLL